MSNLKSILALYSAGGKKVKTLSKKVIAP